MIVHLPYWIRKKIEFCIDSLWTVLNRILWWFVLTFRGINNPPLIKQIKKSTLTPIDKYWTKHIVNSPVFFSPEASLKQLEWRFATYPLFRELSGLFGDHDNEIILDYGCGPGNDLVGFAVYSKAKKIIGMDISLTALKYASNRLALHNIDKKRIELIQISDAETNIKLDDNSIDFINCQGVLMHASHPEKILAEFFRIMKPSTKACLMVYQRESIWFHLYTAYEQMVINHAFPNMTVEDAFAINLDGVDCPLARGYKAEAFVRLCHQIGFKCDYVGGYLSNTELTTLKKYKKAALNDPRLAEGSREFIAKLTYDQQGIPIFQGYYAGVSGIFKLSKSK